MTLSSWQSARMTGTGKPVVPSAFITRYSRSTWCALARSWPGGFLRITYRRAAVAI